MKEIPILFSTPMVQAILDLRKLKTRRVMKPQPGFIGGTPERCFQVIDGDITAKEIKCPYGKPGDILWVRESFSWDWKDYPERTEKYYYYKASTPNDFLASGEHWKPSIHMPKAACRIWLQVTKVTAERLQHITQQDIMAEGVRYPVNSNTGVNGMVSPMFKAIENGAIEFMPKDWQTLPDAEKSKALLFAHWAELWCEINGRESWEANPWVWVIEFKVLSTTGKPSIIHNS